MDKNKMVIKHIKCVAYIMFFLLCLLFMLYTKPSNSFWWWFTYSCVVIAICIGIADIAYTYAKYLIHKSTSED